MIKILYIILFLGFLCHKSCPQSLDDLNDSQELLSERIVDPIGYERTIEEPNSFAVYLRKLPLKAPESLVHYYNGKIKNSEGIYCAVVDLAIGNRDLLQCADACMLLFGEYLFQLKEYDAIRFNFVSDGVPRYFKDYTSKRDYASFRKYMNYIFAYANTRSLHGQLQPVTNFMTMQPGDILIQTGNPYGHAVMVVDMVVDKSTGKKKYLLAQSYMPAQEIQILINSNNSNGSPWYELKNETIRTPEWTFEPGDLRRFTR